MRDMRKGHHQTGMAFFIVRDQDIFCLISEALLFVEREIFRREGWDWTELPVSGRVTDAWTDAGHHHPR